jgi:hypothetical protein
MGKFCAADGKVPLLIASSQARTTTSSVFDADTVMGASIPLFVLRKTLEGRIGAGFTVFTMPLGDSYSCGAAFLNEKAASAALTSLPPCENGFSGRMLTPPRGLGSDLRVCLRGAGANVGKGGRMVEGGDCEGSLICFAENS